jgi:hypothetical protein
MDRNDGVARVVAAGEQALLLELGQLGRKRLALLLELAAYRVVFGRQLLERLDVVELGLELAVGIQLALDARMLGRHLRGPLLVVPEAGRLHVALERPEAPL